MRPQPSKRSHSLPDAFVTRIRHILGDETDQFLHTYQLPRQTGLRLNPKKICECPQLLPVILEQFHCERVPWCEDGYYYSEDTRPGKHPFHAAGLYYIQEPSAMSAVELLDPKPGDLVLDLAAAPGGKSTQILGKLGTEGVLVANEIHPVRAKTLSENIERWGNPCAVVTQETPEALSARFPGFFDKILLDAPCSGEGMFRKDPEAISHWSEEHVMMCAHRQRGILEEAWHMLKPGGTLVYSTCTFSREENELTIEHFAQHHAHATIVNMTRLWPHTSRGEGHFIAKLYKEAEDFNREHSNASKKSKKRKRPLADTVEVMEDFEQLRKQILPNMVLPEGKALLFGDQLYLLPMALEANLLQGLKVLRPGLHLATKRKRRVEPAHALAMAAASREAAFFINLESSHTDISAFLRGETLTATSDLHGWGLVCVEGLPLGWGKANNGQVKNHLPKGLRRLG